MFTGLPAPCVLWPRDEACGCPAEVSSCLFVCESEKLALSLEGWTGLEGGLATCLVPAIAAGC